MVDVEPLPVCDDTDGENVEGNKEDGVVSNRQEVYDNNLLGKVVLSEDEAFNLYNEYALRTGFSVRKGKYRYHQGTSIICQREFYCWKEGFKLYDTDPCATMKANRLDTRTGCKAFIRFTVKDGVWIVTHFNTEHNHRLALPSEMHLLKSGRQMPKVKTGVKNTMVDAGIKMKPAFSYLSKDKEDGGIENVTRCNSHSYVDNKRTTLVEAADAQSLMDYFRRKKAEDPMFFYAVQVDQENRMTNFFWRERKMRTDYDCFGDVVVFDTTYRTNKYNVICAPFVGVNHHWQNIIFGCAFLLEETAASFTWLFKSFVESMGNRAPKTIMTNQEEEISNAIEVVFPNTLHRLCMWDIAKKSSSYLGALNVMPQFRNLFYRCFKDCESEAEFESTWNEMVQKFALEGNNWLNSLYKIRSKWSSAFSGDTFSAGIKYSQMSERTNNVLEGIGIASMSLAEFVLAFDDVVARAQSTELEEDFRCKQGAPSIAVRKSGILIHSSKVYTHRVYNFFEKQFLDCLAMTWVDKAFDGKCSTFEVTEEGDTRGNLVQFIASSNDVCCSCKMFESNGILCSHALRILNVKCFTEIPGQYILKRWTKEAKKGIMAYEESASVNVNSYKAELVWRNSMMRIACNLIDKSQVKAGTRQLCQKKLLEAEEVVERELARLKLCEHSRMEDAQPNEIQCSIDEAPLSNPSCAQLEGGPNTRCFEKQKTKATKRKFSEKTNQTVTDVCAQGGHQALPDARSGHSTFQFFPSMGIVTSNMQSQPMLLMTTPMQNLYSTSNRPYSSIPSTNMLRDDNQVIDLSQDSPDNLPTRPLPS